jgi:hypothetical protein
MFMEARKADWEVNDKRIHRLWRAEACMCRTARRSVACAGSA